MRKVRYVLWAALVLGTLGLLGGCGWLFPPLQAVLVANPTSGTAPLSVTFSAAGSTGQIVSFTLAFGDGSSYTGTNITVSVSHTYNDAGNYVATLIVQGPGGQTSTAQVTITVTAPPPGTTVSLGAIPASGPATLGVMFWATITAAPGRRIKHLSLDFGDGTSPLAADVDFTTYDFPLTNHDYTTPGTFTATLTVTDDATPPQTFTATATIIVTSPPPEITSFTATPDSGLEPLTVEFNFAAQAATGRTIVKYTLLCPGSNIPSATEEGLTGNTLTRNDIMRTYATAGNYTATLKVWDDLNNTDEESVTIEVNEP